MAMTAEVMNSQYEVLYEAPSFKAEIETGQKPDGRWAYSVDVWAHNRGCGTPSIKCVGCDCYLFPTRKEARDSGVKYILRYLENSRGDMRDDITGRYPCQPLEKKLERMIDAIKAELRPKYTQLTIFDL